MRGKLGRFLYRLSNSESTHPTSKHECSEAAQTMVEPLSEVSIPRRKSGDRGALGL